MSWITVIWSAAAGACVIMGLMHLLVWCRDRRSWADLCFFVMVLGVLGLIAAELVMMFTDSPLVYGSALRWVHLVNGLGMIGGIGFVHFYFGTGGTLLLWLAIGGRLFVIVANFATGMNLHLRSIESLRAMEFLGEPVSVLGTWQTNPWFVLAPIATLLQAAYTADAGWRLWRTGSRESRRRALTIGGALVGFYFGGSIFAGLIAAGGLRAPLIVSPPFVVMLLAMSYELGGETLRAVSLGRAVRERDLDLSLAAESAKLGFWLRELPGNQVRASDQFRTMFGFTATEPLDVDAVLRRLHPDDREGLRRKIDGAIADVGAYDTEYRVVLPDGRTRWIACRGRCESSPDADPVRIRGVTLDITPLKRTQELVQASEEKFRLAVEGSPTAIVLVDARGMILLVNAQAEAVFGYARAELIGQAIEVLVPDAARARHAALRDEFAVDATKRTMGYGRELVGRRKDGSSVALEIGLNPIRSREGLVVLASIVDITDRLRAARESVRQRRELVRMSRVAVLGELTASLAHEINQPLTAIMANAQTAARLYATGQGTIEDFRAIVGDIVADTTRARDVIRQVRTMVKDGGSEMRLVHLVHVVEQVLGFLRSDAVAHGVFVAVEAPESLPPVRGEAVQIQQVLVNFLLNAFDAMESVPRSERRVDVAVARQADGMLRVTVCDNGCGIPADKLDRVFEPFFTTKAEGMGMGLSLSRTIIVDHGGTIGAKNNPTRGACFWFCLPAME